MLPTREEALKLIRDGLLFNPGPWGKHCLTAAHCAEKIASACGDMDVEKAYILGLLHDIGRKFGVRHLGHVYDGYVYMKSLGYDEVAKICLTHSFNNHTIDEYIGKFDVTDEELTIIKTELAKTISAMEKLAKAYNAEKVLNVASYAHMYVFEFDGKIIGTGSISSFWGSETESILLSIFVLPEFHGKGVGRKIINILETDEFYVRASRIEIPASITATEFYRKFGYDYKNGVKELDNEHHYRLEKFKEAGLK